MTKDGKQSLWSSFHNALNGIIKCFLNERNMKVHVFAMLLAVFLAYYFKLDRYEIMVLIFTIALVLITEMINTAVEAIVDMVSPEIHPLAKLAKDVAAGAVLTAAVVSLIIGYMLFKNKAWS